MSETLELSIHPDGGTYNAEKLIIDTDERDRLLASFNEMNPKPLRINTKDKVTFYFTGLHPFKKMVFEIPKPLRTDINPTVVPVKELTPHIGMTAPATASVSKPAAKLWDSESGKEYSRSDLEERYRAATDKPSKEDEERRWEDDPKMSLPKIEWASKQIQTALDKDDFVKANTIIEKVKEDVEALWLSFPHGVMESDQVYMDFQVQVAETHIGLKNLKEAASILANLIGLFPDNISQFTGLRDNLKEAKIIMYGTEDALAS